MAMGSSTENLAAPSSPISGTLAVVILIVIVLVGLWMLMMYRRKKKNGPL